MADAILARTAQELRELLREAAQALKPFPFFSEGAFIQGVEAAPPAQGDLGCVVVGPDGELYEVSLKYEPPEEAYDFGQGREDKATRLELPPLQYIPYAYSGLAALAELLARRPG